MEATRIIRRRCDRPVSEPVRRSPRMLRRGRGLLLRLPRRKRERAKRRCRRSTGRPAADIVEPRWSNSNPASAPGTIMDRIAKGFYRRGDPRDRRMV